MVGLVWKSLFVLYIFFFVSGVVWFFCGCFVWSFFWEYWYEDGVFSCFDDKVDGFGDMLDGC